MARVTIKDMIVGEQAYSVPWSLQADQEGRCWIRGDYAFTHRAFGTSKMSIKRTRSGFEVEVSHDTQYDLVYISPEAKTQMNLLPVVRISSAPPVAQGKYDQITHSVHDSLSADD
jgi:hypothetical protein